MARKNVSEMLGYAQTEEDYLNEVIKIKSQDEVLEMLDAFTTRLNDLSDNLKSIQTAAPGT